MRNSYERTDIMAKSNNSGSYWDKLLLSDDELKRNEDLRGAAERGEISWDDAHSYVEGTRAAHGYSGGRHGDQYIKLDAAPALPDSYGTAYREAVERYTQMAPFSYDHRSDPRWQAYQKQYAREGRRASEDTLGRYAAMTGGMPSTAAVTAAQQAGDYYAAQAADRIPELYDLAYAMYSGDADRLYRQIGALQGARDDELARYGTALGQYNADRAYRADRADREADVAYRDRAFEADRADRAEDVAYRDRAFEADRADRAEDVAYRERAYADERADKEAAAAAKSVGRAGGTTGGGNGYVEDSYDLVPIPEGEGAIYNNPPGYEPLVFDPHMTSRFRRSDVGSFGTANPVVERIIRDAGNMAMSLTPAEAQLYASDAIREALDKNEISPVEAETLLKRFGR